jgi:hypothetical protein
MDAYIKKFCKYQHLQIVKNHKIGRTAKQPVIKAVSRLDQLPNKGGIETFICSLSSFSVNVLAIISGQNNVHVDYHNIGPILIFQRFFLLMTIECHEW